MFLTKSKPNMGCIPFWATMITAIITTGTATRPKRPNLDKLKGIHKKLGWNLLLNEHRILEINDEEIAVIGVKTIQPCLNFRKKGAWPMPIRDQMVSM